MISQNHPDKLRLLWKMGNQARFNHRPLEVPFCTQTNMPPCTAFVYGEQHDGCLGYKQTIVLHVWLVIAALAELQKGFHIFLDYVCRDWELNRLQNLHNDSLKQCVTQCTNWMSRWCFRYQHRYGCDIACHTRRTCPNSSTSCPKLTTLLLSIAAKLFCVTVTVYG